MLEAAGARLGIRPLGEDALTCLAAEKGLINIPALAPRALTPHDIHPDGAFTPKRADFVGKSALLRPSAGIRERLQLVALRAADKAEVLPNDATIMTDDKAGDVSQGRMAASVQSEALGHPVALALVLEGHSRYGDTVRVVSGNQAMQARIVKPVLFDPSGRRRHG